MRHSWVLRTDSITENALDAVKKAARREEPFGQAKLYRVIIEPYRKPRTPPQNRTLHMWINEIAEFVGDSPESIKRWLKDDHYPKTTVMRFGKIRAEPKSTADLSAEEMTFVMEAVQALCAEYGIPLTQPDPAMAG